MATMVDSITRERNEAVLEHLGTFNGHLGLTIHGRLRLELGDKMTYHAHPEIPGKWTSETMFAAMMEEETVDMSLATSWIKDDRMTIRTITNIVEKIECAIYGHDYGVGMDTQYNIWDETGIGIHPAIRYAKFKGCNHLPWDEEICTCEEDYEKRNLKEHDYWPGSENYAYVVHGGNEGYLLRVNCEYRLGLEWVTQPMLSGKAFGDWGKLYESAARISYLLQWPI